MSANLVSRPATFFALSILDCAVIPFNIEEVKEPIGKLISQGNKIEPKVANRVVADFIKKKPSALKKYASVGNREGWTEAATSLSQDLADSYFLENKPTLTQIGANMIESYGAGVLMGAGVGKLSFLSQDLATKRRRD